MAIKESTHWYTAEGKPCYTVIGKNGNERNTTLRDARPMNLVPSVTTVMKVAAKPALEIWKIDQALMSVLTLPQIEGESLDEFKIRAKADSEEQVTDARDIGTDIHASIEGGYGGESDLGQYAEAYYNVVDELNKLFPDAVWISEDSFSCKPGYGGKIDLYSRLGKGITVDFKSKDNIDDKLAKKLVYDDNGIQLSAYSQGLGFDQPTRVSVFIDRKSLKVKSHVWDEESHTKHLGMFHALLDYWQLSKGYIPKL